MYRRPSLTARALAVLLVLLCCCSSSGRGVGRDAGAALGGDSGDQVTANGPSSRPPHRTTDAGPDVPAADAARSDLAGPSLQPPTRDAGGELAELGPDAGDDQADAGELCGELAVDELGALRPQKGRACCELGADGGVCCACPAALRCHFIASGAGRASYCAR